MTSMPPPLLSAEEVAAALDRLSGWTGDPAGLRRTLRCPDFPAAIRLVTEIAGVAEERNHHPDIDIRWRTLHLTLATHSAGGVSGLDVELAGRIEELAAAAGAE
jgi:4a-hydroxytetrahydrobiopterin dehydratase